MTLTILKPCTLTIFMDENIRICADSVSVLHCKRPEPGVVAAIARFPIHTFVCKTSLGALSPASMVEALPIQSLPQ